MMFDLDRELSLFDAFVCHQCSRSDSSDQVHRDHRKGRKEVSLSSRPFSLDVTQHTSLHYQILSLFNDH